MTYINRGAQSTAVTDAELYSIDGGTTFEWRYYDSDQRRMVLGATGYTDPAVAMEAVLSYLDGQGGGSFSTRGSGETWTCQTTINWSADNVVWQGDLGITLTCVNNLNNNIVEIARDTTHVRIYNVFIDGNGENQSETDVVCGIATYGAIDVRIIGCVITQCRKGCINFRASFSPSYQGSEDCWAIDCYLYRTYVDDGVEVTGSTNCGAIGCYALDCEGVGFTSSNGRGVKFINCVAENDAITGNGFNVEGYNANDGETVTLTQITNCQSIATQNGINIHESTSYDAYGVVLTNFIALNCAVRGIYINQANNVVIQGGQIVNSDGLDINDSTDITLDGIQFLDNATSFDIDIDGCDYVEVSSCKHDGSSTVACLDCADVDYLNAHDNDYVDGDSGDIGIRISDGANPRILNNYFACSVGLNIANAAVTNAQVSQNDFLNCTTDVSAAGATSPHYGYNLDQSGNWDNGVEP